MMISGMLNDNDLVVFSIMIIINIASETTFFRPHSTQMQPRPFFSPFPANLRLM